MTQPSNREMLLELERKVLERVIVSDAGCWEWQGQRDPRGYGRVYAAHLKKCIATHRATVLSSGRDIPSGMHVDHLCRNTCCCNPDHLEVVTPEENRRRAAAAVVECPLGHPYTSSNTYTSKIGKRHCKECARNRLTAARRRRGQKLIGHIHGEGHPQAKMTVEQVMFARSSSVPTAVLARRWGVSTTSVRRARRGDTWRGSNVRDTTTGGQNEQR